MSIVAGEVVGGTVTTLGAPLGDVVGASLGKDGRGRRGLSVGSNVLVAGRSAAGTRRRSRRRECLNWMLFVWNSRRGCEGCLPGHCNQSGGGFRSAMVGMESVVVVQVREQSIVGNALGH